MPLYTIENKVFELFPAFRRGVVFAGGIDNASSVEHETKELLARTIAQVATEPTSIERERIDIWNAAYQKFGADANKYTPSIRFLMEQVRRGKPPRSINKIVDLFNITSLKWLVPCGGDDLDSLAGGDLCLGIACGDETFAPLFKPAAIENPIAGEVIYYTPQTKQVMCRRWTWRNADFSKLSEATKNVAINIDMMLPPFAETDIHNAVNELADMVRKYCGGSVQTFVLSPSQPSVTLELRAKIK